LNFKTEYKVSGIFLVLSLLWIVFSDTILFNNIEFPEIQKNISMIKGIMYVVLASVVIYLLLRNDLIKLRNSYELLSKTDEMFLKYFNNNIIPSILVDPSNLMIKNVNEAALKLYRLPEYEILSMKLIDLIMMDTGDLVNNKIYNKYVQTICRDKDGNVIQVEVFSSAVYLKGSLILHVNINNISEKMKIQNSLIQSEKRYKNLIENIPDTIYIFSFKKGFQYLSPNFVGMHSKIDNLNRDILLEMVHPEDKNILLSYRKKIYDNVEKSEATYRIVDNGTIKWVTDKAFYVSVFENDVIVEGMLIDYTEKKKLLQELIDANQKVSESLKLKSVILSNLNHEFRTPLNGIMGFTSLLEKNIHDKENKEYLSMISECSYRLNRTLGAMLTLNEVEAGHRQVYYEEAGLKEYIETINDSYKSIAEAKGLNFVYEVKTDVKFVSDINILNQIVINILDNALKFTQNGTITLKGDLKLHNNIPSVSISVKDTGIGIKSSLMNKIFDDFRQQSEGLNRNYEGIGLGLSISKKLVTLLNGKINVSSVENVGSEFSVEIPLKPPQ